MLEPLAHIRVRLQVEDPVAASERLLEQRLIEHIALDQPRARALEELSDELAPTGTEIVDDDHLHSVRGQTVSQGTADEPGAPGDACSFHASRA